MWPKLSKTCGFPCILVTQATVQPSHHSIDRPDRPGPSTTRPADRPTTSHPLDPPLALGLTASEPRAPGPPPLFFVFLFSWLARSLSRPGPATDREIENTPPCPCGPLASRAQTKHHPPHARQMPHDSLPMYTQTHGLLMSGHLLCKLRKESGKILLRGAVWHHRHLLQLLQLLQLVVVQL